MFKNITNIEDPTNEKELISVIVPVYNVEQYLEKCIKSIVSQTYSSLEIILVDDGSTDISGRICDDYQKKDERIIVVHKNNGGLSDARNYALDMAQGKYAFFVDSDDYIPRYAIDYLYSLLIESGSNISIGLLKMTDNHNCECGRLVNGKNIYLFDNKNAISQMLYSNLYSTSAPGKLYEKQLFDDVRFPRGD